MSDAFRIIAPQVQAAGTDVPPEQIQAALNSLAQQMTVALNAINGNPTGPAGGDLSGNYPNPTVSAVHATSGTLDGVVIGGTTPAAGSFTTLSASTPLPVTSGGTGQNALNAHNVILGEGSSAVGFATPGATTGVPLVSNGTTTDPSFGTASVSGGGTGRTTLLAHGVLVGEGTAGINQLAVGNTGQMLLGSTGADPGFGNNPIITGGTIDNAVIGGTTPVAGSFTTLNASGNDALLYQNSGTQSFTSGTAATVTGWTKVFDRLNANFNASTGTFTAPATGYYQVSCQLQYASVAGVVNTLVAAEVVANGTDVAFGQTWVQATGTTSLTVSASAVVLLTAGQTIVIQGFQNSGASRALSGNPMQNYLSINRLP